MLFLKFLNNIYVSFVILTWNSHFFFSAIHWWNSYFFCGLLTIIAFFSRDLFIKKIFFSIFWLNLNGFSPMILWWNPIWKVLHLTDTLHIFNCQISHLVAEWRLLLFIFTKKYDLISYKYKKWFTIFVKTGVCEKSIGRSLEKMKNHASRRGTYYETLFNINRLSLRNFIVFF